MAQIALLCYPEFNSEAFTHMFEEIRQFFEGGASQEIDQDATCAKELQIACCAILLETAFVDLQYPTAEQETIRVLVSKHFMLDQSQAQGLIDLAGSARLKAEKISELVNLINEMLDEHQRQMLYATIWRVIKADNVIDKRELDIVTKLAKRLRLSVDQQIEARQMVIDGKV